MINSKVMKYTKRNEPMAIMTFEDLVGTIEVIAFPKAYKLYGTKMQEDNKVVLTGRVSLEDNKDGKLFCETVKLFSEIQRNMWIQFENDAEKDRLMVMCNAIMDTSDGNDRVILYIKDTKKVEKLPINKNVLADTELVKAIKNIVGEDNIKVVY